LNPHYTTVNFSFIFIFSMVEKVSTTYGKKDMTFIIDIMASVNFGIISSLTTKLYLNIYRVIRKVLCCLFSIWFCLKSVHYFCLTHRNSFVFYCFCLLSAQRAAQIALQKADIAITR
jgi:hypothetical protein